MLFDVNLLEDCHKTKLLKFYNYRPNNIKKIS